MVFKRRLFFVFTLLPTSLICEQVCTNNVDDQTCTDTQTLQLPDDFIDPCVDMNPSCPIWATQGECQANPNYMFANCALSCGSCEPLMKTIPDDTDKDNVIAIAKSACVDIDERCPKWSEVGECSHNPLFMNVKCKRSCWKCVDAKRDRAEGVDEDLIAKKLLYVKMNLGKQNQYIPKSTTDNFSTLKQTVKEYKKVVATIREMDYYAKHIMTNLSVDIRARERCGNQHRMCADWASRGRCGHHDEYTSKSQRLAIDLNDDDLPAPTRDDVLFMMNMCPLACRTCQQLESFYKCTGKRNPNEQPSFESGKDLNAFLEGKRRNVTDSIDNDWTKYEPMFVSYPNMEKKGGESREHDPHVVVLKNFLTGDEADYLQQHACIRQHDNDTYQCQDDKECTICPCQRILQRIAELTNTTISHLEPMEMLQQSSSNNQENSIQHNFKIDSLWKPAGPRPLTLSIILSDRGGIGFPYLDWLQIQPTKGMAVLWSNVRTSNLFESNPLASYEYLPPLANEDESESFVVNVHMILYNWTDAEMRGCS